MNPKKWAIIALILSIGVVIIMLIISLSNRITASANPYPTDALWMKDIQPLELELQKGELTDEEGKNLEAKLQASYYQITLQAEGIKQLTLAPTQAEAALQAMAKPTLIIKEKRRTGVLENPSVPFSSTEFLISNAWQEYINGSYLLVYAGSMAKDLTQGILVVCSDSNRVCRIYLSPVKDGSIRIIDIKNSSLILQSENTKEEFYFDLLALSFTNALGEEVPAPVLTGTQQIPTTFPGIPYP
jgi:hypothetical protein